MASSNSTNKSPDKGKGKALQPGFIPWENTAEHVLYMLAHPAKYTAGDSPTDQKAESDNYNEALKGMESMNLSASITPANSGWLDVKDLNLPAGQPVNPKSLNPAAIDPHCSRPQVSLLFANGVYVPATDHFYTTAVAPWLEMLTRTGTFTQHLSALRNGHSNHAGVGAAGHDPLADPGQLHGAAGVHAVAAGAVLARHLTHPRVHPEPLKRPCEARRGALEALVDACYLVKRDEQEE